MVSLPLVFVGKSYYLRGVKVKAVGETDTGNIKVRHNDGTEEWSDFTKLIPLDGKTKGFIVFPLPTPLAAAA